MAQRETKPISSIFLVWMAVAVFEMLIILAQATLTFDFFIKFKYLCSLKIKMTLNELIISSLQRNSRKHCTAPFCTDSFMLV